VIKRIRWYILTFVLVAALVFTVQFMHFLIVPAHSAGILQTINIPAGASFKKVSDILANKHISEDQSNLKLLAYLMGATHRIKYGEYLLSGSMRPITILEKLLNGEVVLHRVTIPEGYTDEEIAKMLHEKGLLQDTKGFLFLTKDKVFIAGLGISANSLEGFLYPDTYEFSKGLYPKEIIKKMVGQFKLIYTPKMQKRAKEIGMTTLQVIILASMIEKETSSPSERYLISGVFHNRLKIGMRLQSDPTVIYAFHLTNSRITRKELRTKNPYNTYRIKGLPPGPICNPGKESIVAALYPANINYLYFVSKNNGTHAFSKTLKKHDYYVNLYQRKKTEGK